MAVQVVQQFAQHGIRLDFASHQFGPPQQAKQRWFRCTGCRGNEAYPRYVICAANPDTTQEMRTETWGGHPFGLERTTASTATVLRGFLRSAVSQTPRIWLDQRGTRPMRC